MSRTFDEKALAAMFESVDTPSTLDEQWRAKAASATAEAPATPGPGVLVPEPEKRLSKRRSWLAAGAAALIVGAGTVGLVGANQPSPEPAPTVTISPPAPTTPTTSTMTDAPPSSSPPSASNTIQPSSGSPAAHTAATGQPPPIEPTPTASAAPAPARGPLPSGQWPTPANTGIPAGTAVTSKSGDLHVTDPGALVADIAVTGTIYVDAANVTLRRVRAAGIRQRADQLTVEDSEITTSLGFSQNATGLLLKRNDIGWPVSVGTRATLIDNHLGDQFTVIAGASGISLRHNSVGRVTMDDFTGVITAVTIEGNRLGPANSGSTISAPTRSGSRDIKVRGNTFDGGFPCTGWNPDAPGNEWVGNTNTQGAPVYP